MQRFTIFPKQLFLMAAIAFACSAKAENKWGIVGAGNATCEYWGQTSSAKKVEIISWMKGFATSEGLNRAINETKEFRLEMLTSQYLEHEIQAVCTESGKKEKTMFSVLIEILSKFPVRE